MNDYEPSPETILYYAMEEAKRRGLPVTCDECEMVRAWLLANAAEWQRVYPEYAAEPAVSRNLIGLLFFLAYGFGLGLLVGMLIWK